MHIIVDINTVETDCDWLFDGTGQRAKVLKDANFFCCGSCFSARFFFSKYRYEIENNEAAKNCISNIFIPSFHPTFAHSLPPQAA